MQTDAGPVTLNVWTSAVGPDREAQKTEAELQIAQRQATTRNDLYQYSWFSEQFAHYRRIAVKAWLASNIANTLIAWICLALAYGGYYYMNRLHGLKIYVVDLDNNYLGTQIVNAFQASLSQPNHFSLIFDTAFTSNEQVQEAVYDEKAWGAVVVNPGATHNLQQALASGNASYDPTSAVMLITEGARNVLTSGSHVVPGLEALLQPALTQAAENQTASFLAANVANTAALQTALKCPQCLSNGFAYTPNDLRPAYDAAALGTGLSAAIALIVFTFAVSGSQNQIGIAIGEHLSIPSTIVFRLVTCMTAYLFISLSITGVQAAFGVPTTTPFGGRGFVILWMLNWMSVSGEIPSADIAV
ncbi:hypothetical protein AcW1_004740 [Taiwanofungus camphoratus]|nr:hypothetical protein AcV7_003462 [Antrodia cinnamomea]KAI0960136.1 hypothetical protein AcW1_004740 [Antrodia cinnamomea]